tara:strand:+ start:377 stop:856 length:480 start_codon:yes stop_codon:yes gene_type:complete
VNQQPTKPKSLLERQSDLIRKISDASEQNQKETLSFLESLWVHRYGIEKLPKNKTLSKENKIDSGELHKENKMFDDEKGFNLVSSINDLDNEDETSSCLENDSSLNTFANVPTSSSTDATDKHNKKIESNPSTFSPPPKPSINKLRRWISSAQDFPKAS